MKLLRSGVLHLTLVLLAALTLVPLLWMLFASFRPTGMATDLAVAPAAEAFTLASYGEIFTRLRFARALLNSAFVALAVTAIALLFNSLAGYAFAKLRFRGRDPLFRLLSAALVVPSQVAMLPQNYVKLTGTPANQMIKLMDVLDDHEDVKQVWSNFDIEEKEIEASLA